VAIKIINMRSLRRTKHGEEALRDEIATHRRARALCSPPSRPPPPLTAVPAPALRKLKHPNVVELIEDFMIPEKDKWYIVMEFIAGASLQARSPPRTRGPGCPHEVNPKDARALCPANAPPCPPVSLFSNPG